MTPHDPATQPAPENDSKEIAATAVDACGRLAVRLAPVIGERGFYTVFARAVHLARGTFPWLASSPPQAGTTESLFAALRQSLEAQHPTAAADAHRMLLLSFTSLLSSLIGEPLTDRLLNARAADHAGNSSKEPPQ